MNMMQIYRFILALTLLVMGVKPLWAGEMIILQSTTSTHNSGLYENILPKYTAATGDRVRVVAVGTGQAIKNAMRCDGDVLLVHSKAAEEKFVAGGYGDFRRDLMFNDFVFIGPEDDPAGLRDAADLNDALQRLSSGQALFISRGDDSGTHKAERRLWAKAGIDPLALPITSYQEVGNGMGATINIAVETQAYTLLTARHGLPITTNVMPRSCLKVIRAGQSIWHYSGQHLTLPLCEGRCGASFCGLDAVTRWSASDCGLSPL